MKPSLVFILFFAAICSAVQNPIVGDWKVVSVNNGELYYNFEKDSLSVFPEFGEGELDSARLGQIKTMAKFLYSDTRILFDLDGSYKWIFMKGHEVSGFYIVDEKEKIITLGKQDPLDDSASNKISYELFEGKLLIKLKFTEPQGEFLFEKN